MEERVSVRLYAPNHGRNRPKHVVHGKACCVYTRILSTIQRLFSLDRNARIHVNYAVGNGSVFFKCTILP
jgi:hypothetical protein